MADRVPWLALTVLAVAVALDTVTTLLVLGAGGVEANPLVQPFTHQAWSLVALKAGVLLVFAVPTVIVRTDVWEKWIWAAAGLLTAAAVWNLTGVM